MYVCSGHLVLGLGTEHFTWHLVSGTLCMHFVVGRERVLSHDLAAASNSKNAFLLFAKPVWVVEAERSHNLQLTVLYMSLKLPHFTHHNVIRSLTSTVQLCCIQYRMRGYGLISRANYKLVSHV